MELIQWILGVLLLLSSLGILFFRQPVHACLSFLLTLLVLALFYLLFFAQFIAVAQILVYAGAILVIFMFVIILFQDAHQQIASFKPNSWPFLLFSGFLLFLAALAVLGMHLRGSLNQGTALPEGYGTVQSLGWQLYIDYFFPFEALILLFLVALIGSVYMAKRITRSEQ
jgi:NADH-quinone oxidoreductase subunit J